MSWPVTNSKHLRYVFDRACRLSRTTVRGELRPVDTLVRFGAVAADGGWFVLSADGVKPTVKSSQEEAAAEVLVMSQAWAEMFRECSEVAVEPIDHEYLANRFNIDETNLWLLAEEAGEVVRSCGKLGRWGYDHVHQVTGESGMRLLESEVGDFLGIVEIMVARGHLTREGVEKAMRAKLKRLEDWYEVGWTPEDLKQEAPSAPATKAEGVRESGNKPVTKAYFKERADRMARAMFPFVSTGSLAGDPEAPISSLTDDLPLHTRPLPTNSKGEVDLSKLTGDKVSIRVGPGNWVSAETVNDGRVRAYAGIYEGSVSINCAGDISLTVGGAK